MVAIRTLRKNKKRSGASLPIRIRSWARAAAPFSNMRTFSNPNAHSSRERRGAVALAHGKAVGGTEKQQQGRLDSTTDEEAGKIATFDV